MDRHEAIKNAYKDLGGEATFYDGIGMIKGMRIPPAMIGILLIIFGLYLWHGAVFRAKVDDGIINNKLVTTGVCALVRNPIYSAFMFFCTGALMISGNLFFYPLFFFYWIFMTVLMKCTEEKWLKKLYGREYEEYCRRVTAVFHGEGAYEKDDYRSAYIVLSAFYRHVQICGKGRSNQRIIFLPKASTGEGRRNWSDNAGGCTQKKRCVLTLIWVAGAAVTAGLVVWAF